MLFELIDMEVSLHNSLYRRGQDAPPITMMWQPQGHEATPLQLVHSRSCLLSPSIPTPACQVNTLMSWGVSSHQGDLYKLCCSLPARAIPVLAYLSKLLEFHKEARSRRISTYQGTYREGRCTASSISMWHRALTLPPTSKSNNYFSENLSAERGLHSAHLSGS